MSKTDIARRLLVEAKQFNNPRSAYTPDARAFDKLWSAVDWLCDAIDDLAAPTQTETPAAESTDARLGDGHK